MKELYKELSFTSKSDYIDFFNEVQFDVIFTTPDNKKFTVPGFWAKDNVFKVRYDISIPGKHSYETISNDESLHGITGELVIEDLDTDNLLYLHGPICRNNNDMHLSYKDKTPFYWFSDAWWMGLTKRLMFPDDF